MKYTCVNAAYSDFIDRFMKPIDSVAPGKKVRVKANLKPWFDTEIILAIQQRDKLYSWHGKSALKRNMILKPQNIL